ncbi:MAG: SpoIID/LytB domain-containing protein [Deltaproteobacteria bacterium]|nr:SpoIID/LytB domain-containing protein [Deltaproteobacteria bacterium]
MRRAPLYPALFLLLAAAPAPPNPFDSEPLDLPALFDHRFRFDGAGRPVVLVGLMDGQAEVALRTPGTLRVRFRDKEGAKTLQLPPGRRLVVRLKDGAPARVRRWAVLETLERDERLRRDELITRWRAEIPEEVRLFEVGGIYGVEGTVVDNRASLVAAAPAREAELDALMQRLYRKTGVRPRVHDELMDLPRGRLALVDDNGATLATAVDVVETHAGDDPITVEKVEHSQGYKNHGVVDRSYGDRVVVAVDARGKLAAVNALDVDRLLAGIVPSEIFPSSPLEALKAQAVTARGEVFAKVGIRHGTDPYVLCDEQHCQVYSGLGSEKPACTQAVEQTRGEMAFLGGRLVDSVYSAMCGGRSEDNDVVWEVPPAAALRGRADYEGATELLAAAVPPVEHAGRMLPPPSMTPDPSRLVAHPGLLALADLSREDALRRFIDEPPPAWCQKATLGRKDRFRWTRRFTRDEAQERIKELDVGELVALTVEARGRSGRVRTLKVEGSRGSAFVHRELPVRRLFNNLPSGLFVLDQERGAPGGPVTAWVFRGGGFGHGVGMCQTGAVGMAEAGHSYRDILRHYYNGAEVRRVY